MNPNLLIWTSDWHVGRKTPAAALAVAQHIASLQPAGVIDTGDCKDAAGVGSAPQLDSYVVSVRDPIPWATVNPGSNALLPILPGNHDEIADYAEAAPTDFSIFDQRLWGAPYHWTSDWAAPKIRFVGIHTQLVHTNADPNLPYSGYFAVDPAERQWLRDQLAALPVGWQTIVCSHAPLNPAFGNNIGHWAWLPAYGGAEVQQIIRDNTPKVCAYLNGHRHGNMETNVLDGITHFNGPGVAYTIGNGNGGYVPILYDGTARTLTLDFVRAVSPFQRAAGYTPIVIQLPPLPVEPPPPEPAPSFSFAATGTVTINGVQSAATLTGTGQIT